MQAKTRAVGRFDVEMAAVIVAVVMGVFVVAAVAGAIDAFRIPEPAWAHAEQQRSTWIAVLLVLPVTAPVYWLNIRKQLLTA